MIEQGEKERFEEMVSSLEGKVEEFIEIDEERKEITLKTEYHEMHPRIQESVDCGRRIGYKIKY